jgi:hypothetical protein
VLSWRCFSFFSFSFQLQIFFFVLQKPKDQHDARRAKHAGAKPHLISLPPWQHSIDRRQWCLLRPVSQFTCPPSQGAFDSDSSFWAALPQHDCFRTIIRQIHVRFRRSRSSSTEGVGWVGVAHRVRREVVSTLDGGGAVGVRGA